MNVHSDLNRSSQKEFGISIHGVCFYLLMITVLKS